MSYADLARLDLTVRPLDGWPGPETTERTPARFEAQLTSTVEILAAELDHLAAERIVLQLDVTERDLRLDGFPRADARIRAPGVILAFDSRHGPLRYACDRFVGRRIWRAASRGGSWTMPGWQANLRAVALTMENLRAVDRYGATKDGQQYRGFAQLPSGIPQPATHLTTDEAAAFIAEHAGNVMVSADAVRDSRHHLAVAYRFAAKRLHPDRTGDDGALFQRLQAARDLLDRTAR